MIFPNPAGMDESAFSNKAIGTPWLSSSSCFFLWTYSSRVKTRVAKTSPPARQANGSTKCSRPRASRGSSTSTVILSLKVEKISLFVFKSDNPDKINFETDKGEQRDQ